MMLPASQSMQLRVKLFRQIGQLVSCIMVVFPVPSSSSFPGSPLLRLLRPTPATCRFQCHVPAAITLSTSIGWALTASRRRAASGGGGGDAPVGDAEDLILSAVLLPEGTFAPPDPSWLTRLVAVVLLFSILSIG
jgi:hypothetical protein